MKKKMDPTIATDVSDRIFSKLNHFFNFEDFYFGVGKEREATILWQKFHTQTCADKATKDIVEGEKFVVEMN